MPKAAGPAPRTAARTGDGSAAVNDPTAFAPTGELAALLTAVSQSPDERADVIESVAARLAAGEFNTPEAAADAARNLLGDLPAPPSE
jgi:hypothetical protein